MMKPQAVPTPLSEALETIETLEKKIKLLEARINCLKAIVAADDVYHKRIHDSRAGRKTYELRQTAWTACCGTRAIFEIANEQEKKNGRTENA
jgi:hypothetical protein